MATKSPRQRIQDTLNYVQENIGLPERTQLHTALLNRGAEYDQISRNISLGAHLFGNENQRHALRALLLCHQLFITTVAARNQETQSTKKNHSGTSEALLRQRIRSWFTLSNANAPNVCNLATANRATMPKWDNSALNPRQLIRGIMPDQRFNCYNAVVFWAFQGGAISLRWIWNQWYPANTNQLQSAALLPGAVAPLPPLDGNGEHPVPEANVIVMQRVGNPLGHTVMSIGNGLCISQNNKQILPAAANTEPAGQKQTHAATAINDCNQSLCHEISIRFLAQQYYPTAQGYTPMHHPPFWLSYPVNQR